MAAVCLAQDVVLARIAAPVLVVGVGCDEFLDREVFARTARLLPRGDITWIEKGTPAVLRSHPEPLAGAITAFLPGHA